MIKIIEEGHKQFRNTCFQCGCKYTYELEDVNTKTDCVKCPQCGANNVHLPRANAILPPPDPYIGQIALPLNATDNNQSNNPCVNCNYIKSLCLITPTLAIFLAPGANTIHLKLLAPMFIRQQTRIQM